MKNTPSISPYPHWDWPTGLVKLALIGLLIGLLPGLALGTGIGLLVSIRSSALAQVAASPTAHTAETLTGERQSDVAIEATTQNAPDYAFLGQKEAPVKLVIFEDPRCGFCKQLANGAERELIAKYVDTGKVRLISRGFDILGSESKQISIAAACAGEAGRFWQFRDQYYAETQTADGALDEQIIAWAKAAGIADLNAFSRCRTSSAAAARVELDNQTGTTLAIRGTPTLFVNGRRIVGAVPFEMIDSAIAEALQSATR